MADFTINGETLSLDLDDLSAAAAAREAVLGVQKQLEGLQDTADYVTGGLQLCKAVNGCFDQIFGEGTAEKIFDGMRFTQHVEAFVALGEAVFGSLDAVGKSVGAQNERMQAVYAKYSPSRTARRHPSRPA